MHEIELEDVFTYRNIERSYRHCRKGKMFRAAVVKYHLDYMIHLYHLLDRIYDNNYHINKLYTFNIYEPKKRIITSTYFEDKIVQRILAHDVLGPTIQPKLIFDNYASQPRKGTHLAVQRLDRFMRIHSKEFGSAGYNASCDITKYFYTIKKDICAKMVEQLPIDHKLIDMIIEQIYIYNENYNEYTSDPNCGICIGFEPSQWLAVYYLNGMDHMIKEKLHIKYYGRYMDDFYLIHSDQKYLEQCIDDIGDYIGDKLQLSLNPKTHIHPFSQGTCFLGYHLTYNERTKQIETKIRNKSIKRMLKRAGKQYNLIVSDKMSLEAGLMSLESWNAYMKHGQTEKAINAYYKAMDMMLEADKKASHPKEIKFHDLEIVSDLNYNALMDCSKRRKIDRTERLLYESQLKMIDDLLKY